MRGLGDWGDSSGSEGGQCHGGLGLARALRRSWAWAGGSVL